MIRAAVLRAKVIRTTHMVYVIQVTVMIRTIWLMRELHVIKLAGRIGMMSTVMRRIRTVR